MISPIFIVTMLDTGQWQLVVPRSSAAAASARRLYLRAAVGSDLRLGPRFHYVSGGPGIALVRLNGRGK
jgi:hypothetical protein